MFAWQGGNPQNLNTAHDSAVVNEWDGNGANNRIKQSKIKYYILQESRQK